jgi:hypothetical protein
MATAVIGGLVTSTALSLVVVPVVFTYVDAVENFLARLFGRNRPERPKVHAEAVTLQIATSTRSPCIRTA